MTTWVDKYINFDASGANDGSSEANGWQTWADAIAGLGATASVPTRVYVKNPSTRYELPATQTITNSAGPDAPLWFLGYDSITGDGGLCRMRMGTGGIKYDFRVTGRNLVIEGFDIDTEQNGTTVFFGDIAVELTLLRIKATQQAGQTSASLSLRADTICGCYVKSSIGASTRILDTDNNTGVMCYNTVISTNGGSAGTSCMAYLLRGGVLIGNVFDGGGGSKVYYNTLQFSATPNICANNTFYNCGNALTLDGDFFDLAERNMLIMNNLFQDCIYGVYHDTGNVNEANQPAVMVYNNYYRSMTSGFTTMDTNYDGGDVWGNILLSADALTDPSNGDYSLNNIAGGGAVVRNASFPNSTIPGGSIDRFMDVGGLQTEPTASSSSSGTSNFKMKFNKPFKLS